MATAFNEVTSSVKATFAQSATFLINAQTIAIATSGEALVADINLQVNGVQARLNSDTSILLILLPVRNRPYCCLELALLSRAN